MTSLPPELDTGPRPPDPPHPRTGETEHLVLVVCALMDCASTAARALATRTLSTNGSADPGPLLELTRRVQTLAQTLASWTTPHDTPPPHPQDPPHPHA